MKTWLGFLVMLAATLPVLAVERTANDIIDGTRSSNEAKIGNTVKPTACTSDVLDQAAVKCPVACQVNTPIGKLPYADSCDTRVWECAWPKQALSKTVNCPAGWDGTYDKDETYEMQKCGTVMVDTGESSPTTIGCTRTRTETKHENCPTAGGWTGNGVTWSRDVSEKLELDLTTATPTSMTEWKVTKTECSRVVNRDDYATCPLNGSTCRQMVDQSGSPVYSSTCAGGSAPSPANSVRAAVTQHLADDLSTAVNDATGSSSVLHNDCAACTTPWGSQLAHGQSVTSFNTASVPYGQSCASVAETRTCNNGTLSGSAAQASCAPVPPANCNLPWGGQLAHGGGVMAYAAPSVAYGQSCPGEGRYCTNGALSGSYVYSGCTVEAPPPPPEDAPCVETGSDNHGQGSCGVTTVYQEGGG